MSAVLDDAQHKVTSLAALRTPNAPESQMPVVRMGFETLQSFELLQRAAKLLAASTLVPKEFTGNLPNCVIALNMAQRIGADPLMVAQNLYVVHGRPGWSSQFLIATFNQCGRFTSMRFEFFGEKGKPSYGCRAYATEKATGEKIVGADITMELAKAEGWSEKAGSKWKTMPQQMLMYRAASWLVRAYAPEIAMGLQTVEEVRDVFDAEQAEDGSFVVANVEGLRTATNAPQVDAQDAELVRVETLGDKNSEDDVRTRIEAAYKSGDAKLLKIEGDLIRHVKDPEAQNRLAKLFADCMAALQS